MSYIKNLLAALRGSDPFRAELDRVKAEHEQCREQVQQLQGLCLEAEKKMKRQRKMVHDYQRLVENLRKRLQEKERQVELMEEDFEKKLKAARGSAGSR